MAADSQLSAYDYSLPWGTTPDGDLTRNGVTVGFIIGTLAVFGGLVLGVVGIVLNCMGLARVRRQDPSARRFMTASWIVLGIGALPLLIGLPLLAISALLG